MSGSLKAFTISFLALTAVLLVSAVALSIYADVNAWPTLRLALGPVLVLESLSAPTESSMSLGPGIPLLALLGASLNAAAASLLRRAARAAEPA